MNFQMVKWCNKQFHSKVDANEYYKLFLSKTSKRRKPSAIRSLQPLVDLPGMISLGGGMPNPQFFPIENIHITLSDKTQIQMDKQLIASGLQYSPTPGLPVFTNFLMEMQAKEHHPPDISHCTREIAITHGSQDGLTKAFDMLLDSEDTLLVESPTYSGSLAYLQPLNCTLRAICTDQLGLIPKKLNDVLTNWKEYSDGKFPRVLYTIPTGGNPTGASCSEARKRAIYEIASKFNLLIIEDDPYYYLPLDGASSKSYLSMDTEGRVLRFDSFSKILSSGMRLGIVTGPSFLINQINLHTQASNLHTCGISQAIAYSILKQWGSEGWHHHLAIIQSFYKTQRDAIVQAADTHLQGLAEWNVPTAGMFLWIKLIGVHDTYDLISNRAVESKVLFVPGSVFDPNNKPSSYVRAAYSTATPIEMNTAMERLKTLLLSS